MATWAGTKTWSEEIVTATKWNTYMGAGNPQWLHDNRFDPENFDYGGTVARGTADLQLTTGYNYVAGGSVGLPREGTWLIQAAYDIDLNGADPIDMSYLAIEVGASTYAVQFKAGGDNRATLGQIAVHTTSGTVSVAKLMAKTWANGTNYVRATNTAISAVCLKVG